ncbi:MAG: histidine phosphatase family protein [Saprospiraceae bacterium]|nr:histidine phosphatase family protein [Saprospiraceae bacterium]
MSKTLHIIRHGETDYNKNHIVQGRGVNPGLNDKGKRQGLAFFEVYRDVPFEVVLTSTLRRTHETIQPFVASGLPWEIMPEIDELSWGIQEGKRATPELKKNFFHITGEWQRGNFEARTEAGESASELAERIRRFVKHLHSRPEKHLLVCTHGRALRGLICELKGESFTEMERYTSYNTALWKAHLHGESWVFEFENDISHLVLPELAPHK